MEYILNGVKGAFQLIFTLDREFLSIVSVSVRISLVSTVLAGLFGIPLGIWIGTGKFRSRKLLAVVLNTLMSLPTVFVGLTVYSFISRKGPLGSLGLLFTPAAMVIGQFILALPIIAGITMGGVKNLGDTPFVASNMLGADKFESMLIFLKEARFIIMTGIIAGFGRVFAEVGVSMMLGGNIRFYTRNITTAIALETSRGAFALSLALGMVLLSIAFVINIALYRFQGKEI